MFHTLISKLSPEQGQTTSEYVAVTAVGVALALTVIYLTLSGALGGALSALGGPISDILP